MTTLHRYLFTEVIKPFVIISVVLLLLLITTEISDTLTRVLTGQYANNAIWQIISFYIPILLADLLPAAYFLACLTSLHRMSQDSERAVLMAIGISDLKLTQYLLAFTAAPAFLAALYLSHLGAPNAEKSLSVFISEQNNRPITEVIQPKQFYDVKSLSSVIYAQSSNSRTDSLEDVFMITQNETSIRAIRASNSTTQNHGDWQSFTLNQGEALNFSFENVQSQRTAFEQLTFNFSDEQTNKPRLRINTQNSIELFQENKKTNYQEIWKRINKALYIPLFCIWAVVLTRYKPRSAKMGAMASGIALYVFTDFFYATLNSATKNLNISTAINGGTLLWVLAIVGLLLINRNKVS